MLITIMQREKKDRNKLIMKKIGRGEYQIDIAKEFGISQAMVSKVKKRLYWKRNWIKEEEKLRQKALKFYNYKCHFCKASWHKKKLEIHHKNGWIRTKNAELVSREEIIENNQLNNLILTCHSCHQKHHYKIRSTKGRKKIIKK